MRLNPQMPPQAYQTYVLNSPLDLTVRTACEEAGCMAWQFGWESHINEAEPLGAKQAAYIRTQSGRTFREQKTADGITVFRFESRQRCFAEHKTRPETYSVRHGDFRASQLHRVHVRPADWVEDFGGHQQKLADRVDQG